MGDVIGVLLILAGLSFFLQVCLDRIKDIFPFLGGTYSFNLFGQVFQIAPMQFISLVAGIGLMFAIAQPISLIAALGFAVPAWVDYIVNGIIISGGSNYVYDIIHQYQKDHTDDSES